VSQAVSALSAAVAAVSAKSVGGTSTKGLQSVINALSNRISAGGGGAASVGSNNASAASNYASIASNAASVASAAAAVLGDQVKFRSNQVSVFSGNTLSNIEGLSLSMAASALYKVEGVVMFECGTSGGFAFGASLPALGAAGSYLEFGMRSAANGQFGVAAGTNGGIVALSAVVAGQTILASISIATVNLIKHCYLRGMIATSAAGTMQLMGKTSVAGASMSVRGGYLQARRIY
jgi:hypothetical protein